VFDVSSIIRFFFGMYEKEPYSIDAYKKRLAHKAPIIYVATKDNKIIGDSVSYAEDGSLYIWIMGVLQECRRKGIGTKLLDRNELYARENGLRAVTTKVFNVSPEMQNLLKKRGYQLMQVDASEIHKK